MRRVALAIGALLTLSGNAWGWGDHGHKVVCEIAFRLAMPDTRARIRRLIRNDQAFDVFSDACTWRFCQDSRQSQVRVPPIVAVGSEAKYHTILYRLCANRAVW